MELSNYKFALLVSKHHCASCVHVPAAMARATTIIVVLQLLAVLIGTTHAISVNAHRLILGKANPHFRVRCFNPIDNTSN